MSGKDWAGVWIDIRWKKKGSPSLLHPDVYVFVSLATL